MNASHVKPPMIIVVGIQTNLRTIVQYSARDATETDVLLWTIAEQVSITKSVHLCSRIRSAHRIAAHLLPIEICME